MQKTALAAAKKAALARRLVYQSQDQGYYPFSNYAIYDDKNTKSIELFIASRCFIDSPRKWTDLARSNMGLRQTYLHIVELFNYLSYKIGPRSRQAGDGYLPNQVVTFESVPSKHVQEKKAGYRFRIVSQLPGTPDVWGMDAILERLIRVNETGAAPAVRGRKKAKTDEVVVEDMGPGTDTFERSSPSNDEWEWLFALTRQEYIRMCSVYCGVAFSLDHCSATPFSDPHNPVNPYNIFSIKHSMSLAYKAGANEAFYNESTYVDWNRTCPETGEDRNYKFPDPSQVYRMKSFYFKPGAASTVYWPFVTPIITTSHAHMTAFVDSHADDDKSNVLEVEFVYNQSIMSSGTVDDTQEDIEALKKKYEEQIKIIDGKYEVNSNENVAATCALKNKTLLDFQNVFSPDGDSPDAIKAIASFMNDYIAENKTFCLTFQKATSNLTRFGDEMVMLMVSLEVLWNVNTQHRDALCLYFKQLHVYLLNCFNPHTMNNGPNQCGKSYGMKLVMDWLIKGTYVSVAYQSAKANIVPGNKHQCMLRFFEDVFPAFVGITSNHKAGETANTDMEAIVKAWLTSGTIEASVLDVSNGRLAATSEHIVAKVHSVVNVCTNASSLQVPKAMASRYHITPGQSRDRIEGGGLLGKANKVMSPIVKSNLELFKMKMRRNQALTAVIMQLMFIGVIPRVDMTVAKMIFTKTLQEAKLAGLSGIDDIRNFERLEMVCTVLVIWDAISLIWDSPDSVIKGKPHSITDFLMVTRYLRSNVDHATMTIGLLSNQFESAIVHTVIDDLMNTQFRQFKEKRSNVDDEAVAVARAGKGIKKMKRKAKGAELDKNQQTLYDNEEQNSSSTGFKPHEPRSVTEDINYYIAPFNDDANNRNIKQDSTPDLLRILAKLQFKKMRDRPLLDDVIGALEDLASKQVDDANHPGDRNNPAKQIPAIDFVNGKILISKHLVREFKANVLMLCTEKAINHIAAAKGEYVYGVTIPNNPFLLETIKTGVTRPGVKRMQMEMIDSNYFEKSLITITEGHLQGMAEVVRQRNLAADGSGDELSIREAYSELPRYIVDMDLNEYAERVHLLTTGLPQDILAQLPNGNPIIRAAEMVEQAEQNERYIFTYPTDLPHSKPVTFVNEQRKDMVLNPAKYSLNAQLTRREEKNRSNLNDNTSKFVNNAPDDEEYIENQVEQGDDASFDPVSAADEDNEGVEEGWEDIDDINTANKINEKVASIEPPVARVANLQIANEIDVLAAMQENSQDANEERMDYENSLLSN